MPFRVKGPYGHSARILGSPAHETGGVSCFTHCTSHGMILHSTHQFEMRIVVGTSHNKRGFMTRKDGKALCQDINVVSLLASEKMFFIEIGNMKWNKKTHLDA